MFQNKQKFMDTIMHSQKCQNEYFNYDINSEILFIHSSIQSYFSHERNQLLPFAITFFLFYQEFYWSDSVRAGANCQKILPYALKKTPFASLAPSKHGLQFPNQGMCHIMRAPSFRPTTFRPRHFRPIHFVQSYQVRLDQIRSGQVRIGRKVGPPI